MDIVPLLDPDLPTATEPPFVYIVLGAAGSGRREVLADLIDAGLSPGDRAAVLLSSEERASGDDEKLPSIARWTWREGAIDAVLPPGATHVFFVTDGRQNPVDQLEALQKWITAVQAEVGRVLTVVNCTLAEKHAALIAWYEACIHFSDAVLLNRREGVANKWISDFLARFKNLFYPCLFEMVKGGRVKNPPAVLDPQARRMSHIFDLDEWTGIDLEGVEFGSDDDVDGEDAGDEPPAKKGGGKRKNSNESPADDDDWKPMIDPYFQRRPGGRREKEIPDIARYLE